MPLRLITALLKVAVITLDLPNFLLDMIRDSNSRLHVPLYNSFKQVGILGHWWPHYNKTLRPGSKIWFLRADGRLNNAELKNYFLTNVLPHNLQKFLRNKNSCRPFLKSSLFPSVKFQIRGIVLWYRVSVSFHSKTKSAGSKSPGYSVFQWVESLLKAVRWFYWQCFRQFWIKQLSQLVQNERTTDKL